VKERQGGGEQPSRPYLAYALVILCLMSTLNYVDRNVITILLGPIKQDLGLSDSQAGLLTGLAFAAMYSILGVPLARLADRGWRVQVLAGAVAVWSIATACCSLATSFATLLAARMGVGVGEAGGAAPTQALIADYFPPQARGRALGVVAASGGLGQFLGLALGGYLGDAYGWRKAFVMLGVPGMLLAILALLTLKRPTPPMVPGGNEGPLPGHDLKSALRELSSRKSFTHITIGLALSAVGSFAISTWAPVYFMRQFGASASKVGAAWALAAGPATLIGILLGGFLADQLSRRDPRWPVWLFIIGLGGVAPIYLAMLLSGNMYVSVALGLPAGVLGSLWIAPGVALIQNLAGPRLRATAAAVFGLAITLVGMGAGPTLTGVLSDVLKPLAGSESLRYAMCIMLLTLLYGVVHFMLAARHVRADLQEVGAT
jgi:predicted MFS family arabinose efflux permease